jgi:hypothetical protein
MKFYNYCKAVAWLGGVFAAVSVGVLSSMLIWKIAKWWRAF